ncbi:MAG: hypothetical protein ACYS30_14000 [Planctomycetota bacterium]|jgi:hypothetical protein
MAEENKKSDLQSLPGCAVEFVKMIIGKMRYRREVRQDVHAELAAHFEDELKACTSDKEKEQKAQQLISGFGDMKLLAVLLRRAKKRCRPLWRTAVVRTFQTVGVLIVCFIIYIVWFFTGKPAITTDYIAELNNMVRPVADESLNAATLYNKCIEDFDFEELPVEISKVLGKRYYEVTEEDKQLIGKWLTEKEQVLKNIIAGSQRPYYWQHYEGEDMLSVLLPHLSGFRRIAFSLRWRAQLLAEQGRYEEAFSDIKTCYRFGQHLKGDKVLIEQLVAIAIEHIAVQALRNILSEHKINSSTLAVLQQDFEQMVAGEDFTPSLKTEKLFMYDEIQRCFTEDRFGGGHLYLSRIRTIGSDHESVQTSEELLVEVIFYPRRWVRAVKVLFFHPDKQQTREMADRYYDLWDKNAGKTPARLRAEEINIEKEAEELIKDNVLLMILAPALSRVSEISHRNRVDIEAALTIIAILRYEQDSGGYPQNLKQLMADDYLKQLPLDPFSDKPLVYKKTQDSFILYSVGRNFTDEGGEYGKDRKGKPRLWYSLEGDAVFWPVPKPEVKQ